MFRSAADGSRAADGSKGKKNGVAFRAHAAGISHRRGMLAGCRRESLLNLELRTLRASKLGFILPKLASRRAYAL